MEPNQQELVGSHLGFSPLHPGAGTAMYGTAPSARLSEGRKGVGTEVLSAPIAASEQLDSCVCRKSEVVCPKNAYLTVVKLY